MCKKLGLLFYIKVHLISFGAEKINTQLKTAKKWLLLQPDNKNITILALLPDKR